MVVLTKPHDNSMKAVLVKNSVGANTLSRLTLTTTAFFELTWKNGDVAVVSKYSAKTTV